MIAAYILTAQMVGGFAMMPFAPEYACQAAMAGLPPSIAAKAECYPIEMLAPSGSRLAPELAPLPPRKPGRLA